MQASRIALALCVAASFSAYAAEPAPAPTLPKCDKPIASVMVGKMQCKASNCGGGQGAANNPVAAMMAMAAAAQGQGAMPLNVTGIADGIKDVLVTALAETGCFDVQDREQMDEIAKELEFAGKKVQAQQADFLISGAVTQIEMSQDTKSVSGGLLGALTRAPLIGAVAGSVGYKTQKASVGLDMKLVDVNTAKVVASKRAEASSETSSFSMGGGTGVLGASGLGGFGGSLASLKGTNLEVVTKDAIWQSVTFLVEASRADKGVTAQAASTANVQTAAVVSN